jgi:hypothetical protein
MRHYRAYVEFSLKYGFAYAAWDDGGNFRIMERQQNDWNELKDILLHTNITVACSFPETIAGFHNPG